MVVKPSAPTLCACLLAIASAAHASYSFLLTGTTLTATGDAASDVLSVQVSGTDLVFDVGADGTSELTIDMATFDTVVVNAGAGDDQVGFTGSVAGETISVNGEAGDDVLNGGNGGETLAGGDGDDTLDGNAGADQASGGAGRDVFVWDPGDGSDTLDGGTGSDVLRFNGSAGAEVMSLMAGGPGQAQFFRNVGAITMNLTAVETVDVRMLGGVDSFTGGVGLAAVFERVQVNGGAGADTLIGGDTADTLDGGGDAGDTVSGGAGDDTLVSQGDGDTLTGGDGNDRVTFALPNAGLDSIDGGPGTGDVFAVAGTPGDDRFSITGGAGNWTVSEAGAILQAVLNMEVLEIDTLAGDDALTLNASVLDALTLDLDGGPGLDAFSGTNGADVMRGGDGADTLRGGAGNDRLFGDAGTDRLVGAAGADEFHCEDVGDEIDATAEDTVDADCLPAPPPPAVDCTPPAVILDAFPATVKRAALGRSGLAGSVQLDEPAELEVVLLGRQKGSARDVSLGQQALPMASDLSRAVRLSPGRKLLRRLARPAGLTLRVTAIDAAGNRTTATVQVGIR